MTEDSSATDRARVPLLRDLSAPAVVAGFVAAAVSYAGPFVVVVHAARAAGLDADLTSSWMWALALGSGVCGIVLSLLTRTPVVVAFSTPGAALLVASLGAHRFSDAVGAYLVAGLAAAVLGFSGWFGRLLARVPQALLAALLAGILLPFVAGVAGAVQDAPFVAGTTVASFVLARRLAERYAVLVALVAGAAAAALAGALPVGPLDWQPTRPVWTTPTLDPSALLAIGLPLLVVTMASQNAPGLVVLRSAGYRPDDRLLVGSVSAASALLAPFGGHAVNLAALTAALCTGPGAHPDPARRYVAGVACGVVHLAVAVFSTALVAVFAALPAELVASLAGVALLAPLLAALRTALADDAATATAALVTLAVGASGLVVLTVGGAFWGLLAGIGVWTVLTARRPDAVTARAGAPVPPGGGLRARPDATRR